MLGRAIPLLGCALVLGGPASALEFCDELWFTRNLMFDRAGYCFASPLGKAVFDNEGCVGSNVQLDKAGQAMVARVKAAEAQAACKTDTSRTELAIPLMPVRKALVDPPFPSLFESSCIGWKGEPVPLRSARDAGSAPIGEVRPGDTLSFQYEDSGAWSFVEISKNAEPLSMGWARIAFDEDSCEMMAG